MVTSRDHATQEGIKSLPISWGSDRVGGHAQRTRARIEKSSATMLWWRMKKPCNHCRAAYEAKRATSKYCSPRCRSYASRSRAPAPAEQGLYVKTFDMATFNPKLI